jgi:hypothetical protein
MANPFVHIELHKGREKIKKYLYRHVRLDPCTEEFLCSPVTFLPLQRYYK